MKISRDDFQKYGVLVIDPDEDQGRAIRAVVEELGMRVTHVASHTKAMALTEDAPWPCLIVAAQGRDISGLEFCAMLRAREARRRTRPAYVIMMGARSDLVPIVSSDVGVDAYLVGSWMDLELAWKVKRAIRALRLTWTGEDRVVDPATGLLTRDGLKSFLFQEVNRVGRQHGWFSLSVLSIPDHAGLRVSFGEDWLAWFTSGIWAYLRRQLRNYDRLAALGGGMLGLVSPDLDERGTRALLARLGSALDEYSFRDPASQNADLELRARFLCVRVLGDYKQFGRTGEVLWAWLQDRIAEPLPPGIDGDSGRVALELELGPEFIE
jgi:PleD family two-component response regulator